MADACNIITLGCRLNAYESEAMGALADAAGVDDAVVINTCAVTNEAVRQARQAIRRARRDRPDARIVVTGCAAQIDPGQFAAMAEVDAVIGNQEKMSAGAWSALARDDFGAERVRVNDIMSVRETATHMIDGFAQRTRAFVQIQNGCDHRCTFCIIPYGRGNSRSVPVGAVIDQIGRLVDNGCKEIVLTGVDITSYGDDLPGRITLGSLVEKILDRVPELPLLRLSSLDTIEIDEALFRAITEEDRVAPHLHLSLQSGDDMILKRMKRRHSSAAAARFTEAVRARRSEVAFGADIIAGFPTETEDMFANTLRHLDDCGIVYLHAFPFSPREGTPAARMPQLPRAVVKERAARLRAHGEAALFAFLDARTGASDDVLIESDGLGRTRDYARVRLDGAAEQGEIVRTRLTRRDGEILIGERAA